jgi:5'-3' exonuclease
MILIDLSYFIFYRYYATYNWYRRQTDAIQEHVIQDPVFIAKYDKIFEQTITQLVKKHEFNFDNLIFAKDCPREDIWRVKYYAGYKMTREDRLGTFDKEIFKHTICELIPRFQKKYGGCHIVSVPKLESDDIVGIIKQHVRAEHPKKEIVIITNDNDYVQLIDNYTLVVNLEGKDLRSRIDCAPLEYLERKIILGDKSDNIPSIGKKIGDKTATKLATSPSQLQQLFDKKPETKTQYELNKLLISFNMIPLELRSIVIENYIKIYQ